MSKNKDWKEYKLYKRKKDKTGACSTWAVKHEDRCIWLSMAKQKDEKTFDHDNAVTVKLGLTDVGQLIAAIEGDMDAVGSDGRGMLHKFERDGKEIYTTIGFSKLSKSGEAPRYSLCLSKKEDNNISKVSHVVLAHEARILLALLKFAVPIMSNWV